jgi:type IV pilus assembly protein PilW
MMRRYGCCSQQGFSLVELMVALVIGLIITLGAGQLFLMGLQSFRQVEQLSERQQSLRFLSDVMSLDIRTASSVSGEDDELELRYAPGSREADPYCSSSSDILKVLYNFDSEGSVRVRYSCSDDPDTLSSSEVLVSGLGNVSFSPGELYVVVSIGYEGSGGDGGENDFTFRVARRTPIAAAL